jgi:hypothetical protein
MNRRRIAARAGSSVFLFLLSAALLAQKPAPAQSQDEEFARLVKEWTTKPEFLSPLVDHLPKVAGVPSPKDVLGRHIGAPNHLTYYDQAVVYYRALAAKSPRVKVIPIGTTDEGREYVVVFVGSEESIRNLEHYREYLGRLADPRRLSDAQATEIIAKAKPIYHLMGGLHSTETGPPEMLMELAYRLTAEESALVRQIRDQVIVSITPVADPDGRDRAVDWYYRHKVDITDEDTAVGGPPYWGKYVFHDNNRDINYSQVTMRALLRWYLQWHPPIMHDLHESVPFLYTFSGQAPQNPSLDPILYGELPWFANFEMVQMTKYGMPGVWTHAFVDMWSPGYLAFMSSNHNGMVRMYEAFGNGGATTMNRRIDRESQRGGPGRTASTREWYRPTPPYKEVLWSLRNNTNYMQTGVLLALQLTSAFPKVVLENFYLKSRNAIEAGKTEAPFGYVIPAPARGLQGPPRDLVSGVQEAPRVNDDMTRVAFVIDVLRLQGIEVGRTTREITVAEGTFPAGSFVIKRDQPYGRLAKILLEKQNYPDPSLRTYDDTGWTMGLMAHADVREIGDKAILDVPLEAVDDFKPAGTVEGEGGYGLAIAHNGSANLVTLRYRLRDLQLEAAEQSFKSDAAELFAGSLIIAARPGTDAWVRVKQAVEQLGLSATALAAAPDVKRHPVDLPRLAIYSTWGGTQGVGWVRHAFDRYEIAYDLIFKERIKRGNLRAEYDMIVIPNQGSSGKSIVYDIEPRGKPLAYTRTDRFKYLGQYGESEDITGGMGLTGAAEFQKFVEEGGLLVTLGAASFFPTEFGLTRHLDASRPTAQFYAPGPIVEATVRRPEHPIFYGYGKSALPVRYANGPLLSVPERFREKQVLMQFQGTDKAVLSGLMRNPAETRDRPAIVDAPVGRGRVLLFATNPCYRWQNLGEFNMLFNAVLHHNDLAGSAAPAATSAQP